MPENHASPAGAAKWEKCGGSPRRRRPSFRTHGHRHAFSLGEAFLGGIEGQKLGLAQMQRRGHVQDVLQPVAARFRVLGAQCLGQLVHERPVHWLDGEHALTEV